MHLATGLLRAAYLAILYASVAAAASSSSPNPAKTQTIKLSSSHLFSDAAADSILPCAASPPASSKDGDAAQWVIGNMMCGGP